MKSRITLSRLLLISLIIGSLSTPDLYANPNYYDVLATAGKDSEGSHKTHSRNQKRRAKARLEKQKQELLFLCKQNDNQSIGTKSITRHNLDTGFDADHSVQQEILKLYLCDEEYQNIIRFLLFTATIINSLSELAKALESPELEQAIQEIVSARTAQEDALSKKIDAFNNQKITKENAPLLNALFDEIVRKSNLSEQPPLHVLHFEENESPASATFITDYDDLGNIISKKNFVVLSLEHISDKKQNISDTELKAILAHEIGHIKYQIEQDVPGELPSFLSKEFFEQFFDKKTNILLASLSSIAYAASYCSSMEELVISIPETDIFIPAFASFSALSLACIQSYLIKIIRSYATQALARQPEEIYCDNNALLIEPQGLLTCFLKSDLENQYQPPFSDSLNFESYKPQLDKLNKLEKRKSLINKAAIYWAKTLKHTSYLILLFATLPYSEQESPLKTVGLSIWASSAAATLIIKSIPEILTHPPDSDRAQAAYDKLVELRKESARTQAASDEAENDSDEDEPIFFM